MNAAAGFGASARRRHGGLDFVSAGCGRRYPRGDMRCLSLIVLTFFALSACRSAPPVIMQNGLTATPSLAARLPVDIAVLPIQDDTPAQTLAPFAEELRSDIASALARRLYSPLAPAHVDSRVDASALRGGSIVDAGFVQGWSGRFDEDAVLGVRITRWDERTMMHDARVDFGAEVMMVGSDGAVLWSGRADGSVKAGGSGPAPIPRRQRSRSAIEVFADALIDELPVRR